MMKKVSLLLLALTFLLISCAKKDSDILLTVNKEPIFNEELERIKTKYSDYGLTETEIVEGMILELVTLQQADELAISVAQDEANTRYDELIDLGQPLFLEKVITQYGNNENYKKALYYKLLYDKISERVKTDFSMDFKIKYTLLQQRTDDYLLQYTDSDFEKSQIDKESFSKEVAHTYYESCVSSLEDLYFKVWQYKKMKDATLSFDSYSDKNVFQKQTFGITNNALSFKGKEYELKDISFKDVQDRFGNYLYLPNSIEKNYHTVVGKAIHITFEDVRGLYLVLGNEDQITIEMIASPLIPLYNDFSDSGLVRKTADGSNRIEYIQSQLGIYYSITGKMEYTDLEAFLNECIPYVHS